MMFLNDKMAVNVTLVLVMLYKTFGCNIPLNVSFFLSSCTGFIELDITPGSVNFEISRKINLSDV